MAEKKTKENKIELQTRVPQKRVGIFDNLGKGKQQNVKHPFSEIVNFPVYPLKVSADEFPDVREKKNETPELKNLGHPNIKNPDVSPEKSWMSDLENLGHPNIKNPDVSPEKSWMSDLENLGHPNSKISDTKTPETRSRTSEKGQISDTKTSEKFISDIRDESKTVRRNYDAAYEEKRKKNDSIDRMNLRPHFEIGRKIRVFCAKQGMELTEFFQLAALAYIENLGHPNSKTSDTKTPLDDRRLMIYKTKPSIINLYLEMNRNFNEKTKWKVRDDEAAFKFNECDIRLIELGIIQTQTNKNYTGKINSFSYYVNEIQNFVELEMTDEGIQMMLEINRRRRRQAIEK